MKDLIPKSIFNEDFGAANIGFCNQSNIEQLFNLKEGTVFVPQTGSLRYIPLSRQTKLNLILVDNPRLEFAKALETYFPIFETYIHPTVKIGQNTLIHEGTRIGENVIIGDNCVIGGDGFGYVEDFKIPHKGNVVIESGVHIGSNTCIDRAVVGSTKIGKNTKIDNLVHIAHGVVVGESCKIVAGSVIGGSVQIGNHVWIGINASIREHLKIGDRATVGMGAVVVKSILGGTTVKGNPAK